MGGLAGGSGALGSIGLPEDVAGRINQGVSKGEILIAVHTDDTARTRTALEIMRAEKAEYVYEEPRAA